MTSEQRSELTESVLRLCNDSRFGEAVNISEKAALKGLLPVSVFAHLSRLLSGQKDGSRDWRAYLDGLIAELGARVHFSTFKATNGYDFSAIPTSFSSDGNGSLRIGQVVEFVTIGDQNCALSYSGLPPDKSLVVHFLAAFPSNVNDNFYLSLEGEDCDETFRFSNYYVALCADATTLNINTRVPKLYTIAVNQDSLSLFVNGILEARRKRVESPKFTRLRIKLIGSPSADLGGILYGLEIWSSSRPFTSFYDNDLKLLQSRMESKLNAGKLSEVYDLVRAVDDTTIRDKELSQRILNSLKNELGKKGFQEWLFDGLLGHLAPKEAEEWKAVHTSKFPTPVLSVKGLTVQFYRFPNKRFALSRLVRMKTLDSFTVLDNISFELYPGDILGIVGANGAGKSTLLKTVAGLVPITQGLIALRGHHQLLSPGLGVRNELSGRDNIYLAGCFAGLNRRIVDRLYDDIVSFAELGDFIDQPFKYYSDGMKSRLIFSMATSFAPEILLLDELLSSGDVSFQQKAAKRMDQLIDRAKAVVIATHGLSFVAQKCNKALLISHGKQLYYGDSRSAITYYLNEQHISPGEYMEDTAALSLASMQLQGTLL